MDGQSARAELHGHVSIFKAARRELNASVKTMAIVPAPVKDASFAGARRLHPAQGLGSLAAVISSEEEIPDRQDHNRADDVDD
jgi:hypothetical protein